MKGLIKKKNEETKNGGINVWMEGWMDERKGEKGERYQCTFSVVIVLCLVAGPQVADQSLHLLRLQFTVGQLHLISRASDSGG